MQAQMQLWLPAWQTAHSLLAQVCDNGWVEVSYEGQTAYVSGDYVSAVAADAGAANGAADVGADQAVDASTEG